MDFWVTWCLPCRAETHGFVALQKKYADKGLSVIGVSLDKQGPSVVKPLMRELGINYPVVMGDPKIVADYGFITAIPTTFVIDRQGLIVIEPAPREDDPLWRLDFAIGSDNDHETPRIGGAAAAAAGLDLRAIGPAHAEVYFAADHSAASSDAHVEELASRR